VLVAAVLRPEERKDDQLEVVRLPLEQLTDTYELGVGQTERAMKRLFFEDPRQRVESSLGGGRVDGR